MDLDRSMGLEVKYEISISCITCSASPRSASPKVGANLTLQPAINLPYCFSQAPVLSDCQGA